MGVQYACQCKVVTIIQLTTTPTLFDPSPLSLFPSTHRLGRLTHHPPAPMWQVIQAIDRNPADKTKVTLLFANLTEKDILLKEEFDRLAKAKPEQFKIVHVIEKGEAKSLPKGYLPGRVDHDILAKNLPLPGLADKTKIFVCGPPPMVEVTSGQKTSPKDQGPLKGFLADLGYQPDQVYKVGWSEGLQDGTGQVVQEDMGPRRDGEKNTVDCGLTLPFLLCVFQHSPSLPSHHPVLEECCFVQKLPFRPDIFGATVGEDGAGPGMLS